MKSEISYIPIHVIKKNSILLLIIELIWQTDKDGDIVQTTRNESEIKVTRNLKQEICDTVNVKNTLKTK